MADQQQDPAAQNTGNQEQNVARGRQTESDRRIADSRQISKRQDRENRRDK